MSDKQGYTAHRELTPEALAAGVEALRRYSDDYESLESAVRRIWEAMCMAERPRASYDDDH